MRRKAVCYRRALSLRKGARTMLKAWSAGGVPGADAMMLDVAIDLFKTEDTTKGMLNSARAIEAGVQPSPLTFLGR